MGSLRQDTISFFTGALLALCAVSIGHAAEGETHKTYYKAFNEKLEAGDIVGAMAAAKQAWQAAEAELGAVPTTAILAYNYADIAYMSAPARAAEALARVFAIIDDPAEIGAPEARLLADYLATQTGEPDIKAFDALADRLADEASAPEAAPTILKARSYRELLKYHLSRKSWRRAAEFGVLGAEQFAGLGDNFFLNNRIEMHLAAGVAYTEITPFRADAAIGAFEQFETVIKLSPPQRDIASFSEALASAISWRETLVHWSYASVGVTAKKLNDHSKRSERTLERSWTWIEPRPEDCSVEWISRKSPKYPSKELNQLKSGVTLVGYDINPDGSVSNITVFTPPEYQSEFQQNAVEIAKEWRADMSSETRAACFKNNITHVVYRIT